MNIVEAFLQQVKDRPDALAIVHTRHGKSRTISFADLDLESRKAAAMLRDAGLCPGDAVLLLHPMSIELYVALIAIFRLGLVAVVFDPSAGLAHIERCCSQVPLKAFIGSCKAHLLRLISRSIRRIPCKIVVGHALPGALAWSKINNYGACDDIYVSEDDTPALLTFTSGSTGTPKAALRTHGFLMAQFRSLADSLELQQGEVDLTTLPIFALANIGSGVTSVIPDADLRFPGKVDPAPIITQIVGWNPTRTGASPAFLERLADECLRQHRTLPSLRRIYLGGAPVFPPLIHKLKSVAPDSRIIPVYGSTEAEPIAHICDDAISAEDYTAMAKGKGLLAGVPVPSIQLRILNQQTGKSVGPYTKADFESACLPIGEPGEIVVSGQHVLPGYLDGQGNAETKFRVDDVPWHRTEDAGYIDTQGRVWLLGRCSARINDDRGILYPFAIECGVINNPAVNRAAVIAESGLRILTLELREKNQKFDLSSLEDLLTRAKIDKVLILKTIPVDARHNAKVDYPTLRKIIRRE